MGMKLCGLDGVQMGKSVGTGWGQEKVHGDRVGMETGYFFTVSLSRVVDIIV